MLPYAVPILRDVAFVLLLFSVSESDSSVTVGHRKSDHVLHIPANEQINLIIPIKECNSGQYN